MFACFIRVSQVMCLLPGSGRGPETELHPDGAAFGAQQHRRWRVKGLVFGLFGDDGVMSGEAQWSNAERTDQDTAVWKRRQGNDERRYNAASNLRCTMLVEQISVNWKLFFTIVHFLRTFQWEEFGDQSKIVQNKRQTSKASYHAMMSHGLWLVHLVSFAA